MTDLSPFLNRLIHGDCLSVMASLPADSVHLIVTDPPYGVTYRPRDGRTIAGDDTTDWMQPAFAEMYRVLRPDSFCLSFYGWPQADVFLAAARAAGFRPVSHLVFLKEYGSRRGYTSGCHEVAFLLAKGRPQRPSSPPRDVLPWTYTENRYHPTQKPVTALSPLIAAYSAPGDIVLDPFAGSASTAVAASQLGRAYIAIEKDARYFRQAEERLRKELSPGRDVSSVLSGSLVGSSACPSRSLLNAVEAAAPWPARVEMNASRPCQAPSMRLLSNAHQAAKGAAFTSKEGERTMTTNNDNQPVKQFRSINGLSASIWKRTTRDGEVFYTASLDRSYKDKDGAWQRTSTFRHDELHIVGKLAAKAEAFIDDLLQDSDAA